MIATRVECCTSFNQSKRSENLQDGIRAKDSRSEIYSNAKEQKNSLAIFFFFFVCFYRTLAQYSKQQLKYTRGPISLHSLH